MINYFPTQLARGKAFCNRTNELKRLRHDIETVTPSLIISPRRYGKTSLALNAFERTKWPYVHVDLYKAFNEEDVERFLLKGIASLLSKLEKTPKRLIALAADFFSNLHVSVSIGKEGLQLDFKRKQTSPVDTILKSLEHLHELAKTRNTKVILYLDEFQVVGQVCKNYTVEAAVREVAQKSEFISFVFSGSDRHLIEQLFNDKKRPFYHLCDTITLKRISENDYTKHLKKAAIYQWETELAEETIERILHHTERHAYYFNKLSSLLWLQDTPPSAEDVTLTWMSFVTENKSLIEREIALLTVNQRRMLLQLAEHDTVKEPFGKAFLADSKLSGSTASMVMKVLIERDYVFIDEDDLYRILDPLMKSVLADTKNVI